MKRRFLGFLALALATAFASWFFREHFTIANLAEQERRLRSLVTEYPVRSRIVGFLLYVAASLVPGTTGKSILYGWLFGFWTGFAIVNLGLTAAAVLVFLAMRLIFQSWVHENFPDLIVRVDEALLRDGPFYLVMLRIVHAPYTLTNYAMGATAVPLRTFWWTTHLGLIPGNVAFVLAGAQIPSLDHILREGVWSLVDIPLWIGLSLAAFFPVAVRWAVRRWYATGQKDGSTKSESSAGGNTRL